MSKRQPQRAAQFKGKPGPKTRTADTFANFTARVGIPTDNLSYGSSYTFTYMTRNRQQLEAMYRGSWLIGAAVDAPAEDMVRAGIDITSEAPPDDIEKIQRAFMARGVWTGLTDAGRWGRLFGGAIAVILIEGQDMSTPLRLDSIGKDQFKGLLVLDRWMANPVLSDVITEYGPNLGKPKFYDVVTDSFALRGERIHYSRVIRFEGITLPYFQKLGEQLWGESVVERIFDRLVAFDSATLGTAQLVYRAYLRTMKVKDYRNIVAMGGPAYQGLINQVTAMRQLQSNEGITLMDSNDEFETHQYSFGGLSDVLNQFGEQVSGAVEVPLVRLFGQSPSGFSTGETDLQNYYDSTNKKQETHLRMPVHMLLEVVWRSELGTAPPEGTNFTFRPLKVLAEKDRADIAASITTTVQGAWEAGLIKMDTALKELRAMSKVTGIFTNITDEEIAAGVDTPPPNAEQAIEAGARTSVGGDPQQSEGGVPRVEAAHAKLRSAMGDAAAVPLRFDHNGLPITIETARGEVRRGQGWAVKMPAHYGFIEGTSSAEGPEEGMDCYVGPFWGVAQRPVYVINQMNPTTGDFDEHKVMLGFMDEATARLAYLSAFNDGSGVRRMMSVVPMGLDEFKDWVQDPEAVTKPLSMEMQNVA